MMYHPAAFYTKIRAMGQTMGRAKSKDEADEDAGYGQLPKHIKTLQDM